MACCRLYSIVYALAIILLYMWIGYIKIISATCQATLRPLKTSICHCFLTRNSLVSTTEHLANAACSHCRSEASRFVAPSLTSFLYLRPYEYEHKNKKAVMLVPSAPTVQLSRAYQASWKSLLTGRHIQFHLLFPDQKRALNATL